MCSIKFTMRRLQPLLYAYASSPHNYLLTHILAKCAQRKTRCTYVKFHCQMASSGPGHHNPRPTPTPSSLGNTCQPGDDFILGPPHMSVPSIATSSSDPIFTTAFPFNHSYPSSTNPLHLSMSSDVDMTGMFLEPHNQRDSTSSFSVHEFQGQQSNQHSQLSEGRFSSAFGLMSIDDPNVLAGLSTDGVPFFSNVAINMHPHSPKQQNKGSQHVPFCFAHTWSSS